jgi:hypothetical protein
MPAEKRHRRRPLHCWGQGSWSVSVVLAAGIGIASTPTRNLRPATGTVNRDTRCSASRHF